MTATPATSMFIGTSAAANAAFATSNNAIGTLVVGHLASTDPSTSSIPQFNTLVGSRTSRGTATFLTVVGHGAGPAIGGQMQNSTVLGHNSVQYSSASTTLTECVVVGHDAFVSPANAIGSIDTTAVGHRALSQGSFGPGNNAVGNDALHNCATGTDNVAVGHLAGYNLLTGSQNVIVGSEAGASSMTSFQSLNTLVGDATNVWGSSNTVVGAGGFAQTGADFSIVLGQGATTLTGAPQFVLGDEAFYGSVVSTGNPGPFTNALNVKIGNHTFQIPLVAA